MQWHELSRTNNCFYLCLSMPALDVLIVLSSTYRMEGRILLFRSTAIPWSFCSLLKICVFSFDDRLTVEYRLPLLRAVVGACCFTELRSISQERLRAAIASWCAGDRRTFSVYAFRRHQDLSSNDTLPAYRRLPTKSLNSIRVHQEPTDAPNRTSSLPCKRARNLIQSKLPMQANT